MTHLCNDVCNHILSSPSVYAVHFDGNVASKWLSNIGARSDWWWAFPYPHRHGMS